MSHSGGSQLIIPLYDKEGKNVDHAVCLPTKIILGFVIAAIIIATVFYVMYSEGVFERFYDRRVSTAALYAVEDQPGKTYKPYYGGRKLERFSNKSVSRPHKDLGSVHTNSPHRESYLADLKNTFGIYRDRAIVTKGLHKSQREFMEDFESVEDIDKASNTTDESHRPELSEEQLVDIISL